MILNPASNELNYVVVNGVQSPGRATISGLAIPYVWDVKRAYGMSGAITIFRGRDVAKFTLTIALWRPEHFLVWPIFAKVLEPPKPGVPLVVSMQHPSLSAADISAVAVERLGIPERQPNGLWLSTSQIMEYRPPLPALVKPRGAVPAVDKGKGIPPKTEADKALEEAQKQFTEARTAAQ